MACCLLTAACQFDRAVSGPLRSDAFAIDRGEADRANVELDMGAGEMNLRGGADKLIEGTFEYNVDDWKPLVKSAVNGSHATVTIRQPEGVRPGHNRRYTWNLRLNDSALLDLAINCGAGQATLDLGSLHLRGIEVHMGAGQVDLDLRGNPTHDYEVRINGGVGQANLKLPTGVGIWAEAKGGLGSIHVSGLEKRGNHWENDLYDKAKVNVRVQVHGGIGEIRITA
ncbi:MAG TPA: toast rack family protein [Bryobacteraceae bacterium]|nr:toast rack family protein [Bryobacteraceae bacterium]